ncbi:FYVE zinc finger-domain-containing protein [Bombardia bombarda]|uniref:FYVE zinc finger-domain-containing protein n=1 Tax=Bombardia bombarda TaxID=252184 RepID=A0AA39WVG0_9PEZI|nr:FYVE zinc finger-domain-containing protein [Bombardia bombarda]
MSSRRLGGGRILGSGKGLAPPSPSPSPSSVQHQQQQQQLQHPRRSASPFAPSESSTVSFHSRNSTQNSISPLSSSPLPDFAQDLTSNISLAGPSNGAQPSNRLVCPICEEEMVTLLQLNRHIDDLHQELPEAAQDEVKTWFDKQVLKAKRFQPLSIINQKIRGLDVFESNETQPVPMPATASGRPIIDTVVDPEELVTRKHWQRPTGTDFCTDPPCGKRLNPLNGNVHCRNCGRLFCEEHTMYQMKLSRSANHEPVRGVWCRVCETCYKSRDGYNDHNGLIRDHMAEFSAIRAKRVDRHRLEVQRLEKRLTKLTRMLADAPPEAVTNGSSLLSPVASLAGQKNQRKMIEQSVVTWEDDAVVTNCPFCKQEFRSWTFRRHHCRMCGRVVCADPHTGCSSEVGLNVSSPTKVPSSEKPTTALNGQLHVDVRMCRDCKSTIFSLQDFADSISHKPPDQRAYETLRQFERGIRMLMPSFQKSLLALQPPDEDDDYGDSNNSHNKKPPPTHAQIQEAAKIRKRLTDAFAKYDVAAKRIRDMKTSSPTQLRLQKAIYASASTFLHTNLIPMKGVPQILKSTSSSSSHHHRRLLSDGRNGGMHLSPLRNGESASGSVNGGFDAETSSVGGASEVSTALSALETEEKEARERLIVLEEQRFLVKEMLDGARGRRRMEEVGALTRNLDELDREIEHVAKVVRGWLGDGRVYTWAPRRLRLRPSYRLGLGFEGDLSVISRLRICVWCLSGSLLFHIDALHGVGLFFGRWFFTGFVCAGQTRYLT